MNKKELYKVTITDENGKVMHEVESDCIIAAISDPSRSTEGNTAIHGIHMANCPTVTIKCAFNTLGIIKREAIAKNPALEMLFTMERLSGLAKKFGVNLDEKDAEVVKEED